MNVWLLVFLGVLSVVAVPFIIRQIMIWYRNMDSLFEYLSTMKLRKKGMKRAMTADELKQSPVKAEEIQEWEYLDEYGDQTWKPLTHFYGVRLKKGPE